MTRREWCSALAKLVSPSFPTEAAEALHSMLPALTHLPDEMFTKATLLEVAGCRRRQAVPAWDELIGALNGYRRTYLPDPTLRLAAPQRDTLPPGRPAPTPEEVAVVSELLTSWRHEMAHRERPPTIAEIVASRPFRDVTLKGEALHRSRVARGCYVPVPGYEPTLVASSRPGRELSEDWSQP